MNHTASTESSPLCLKIWNLAREQLSVKYPFFRKLIWDFSFQESSDTHTAGTDGHTIYFAPQFLIQTFQNDPDALETLFLHMLYHCLFLHLVMETPADPILWNQACDLAVEHLIKGIKDASSPSVIYHELQTTSESTAIPVVDDHQFWKLADRKKLLEQMKNVWNSGTGAAGLGLYGNSGRGTAPGNLAEELTLKHKHRYDFRRFLRRFAVQREELHTDTSSFDYIPYVYGLDHYGNMPLIEHLEYQEMNRMEELVIAIDTSGSCTTETVRRFMEETYGILSDHENFFRKMNLYIIQCDSFIQDCAHITCEKDWKRYLSDLQIHGRGGTDFRPVFEHVKMLRSEGRIRNLKGLLYFTDGDGIYPQRPTTYQTAFVFYHEKALHQQVPTWATKLYLDDKNFRQ